MSKPVGLSIRRKEAFATFLTCFDIKEHVRYICEHETCKIISRLIFAASTIEVLAILNGIKQYWQFSHVKYERFVIK